MPPWFAFFLFFFFPEKDIFVSGHGSDLGRSPVVFFRFFRNADVAIVLKDSKWVVLIYPFRMVPL